MVAVVWYKTFAFMIAVVVMALLVVGAVLWWWSGGKLPKFFNVQSDDSCVGNVKVSRFGDSEKSYNLYYDTKKMKNHIMDKKPLLDPKYFIALDEDASDMETCKLAVSKAYKEFDVGTEKKYRFPDIWQFYAGKCSAFYSYDPYWDSSGGYDQSDNFTNFSTSPTGWVDMGQVEPCAF